MKIQYILVYILINQLSLSSALFKLTNMLHLGSQGWRDQQHADVAL